MNPASGAIPDKVSQCHLFLPLLHLHPPTCTSTPMIQWNQTKRPTSCHVAIDDLYDRLYMSGRRGVLWAQPWSGG